MNPDRASLFGRGFGNGPGFGSGPGLAVLAQVLAVVLVALASVLTAVLAVAQVLAVVLAVTLVLLTPPKHRNYRQPAKQSPNIDTVFGRPKIVDCGDGAAAGGLRIPRRGRGYAPPPHAFRMPSRPPKAAQTPRSRRSPAGE